MRIVYLSGFICLLAFGLFYTHDLKQSNSEKIFLTQESLQKYLAFQNKAPNKQFLILKKKFNKEPTEDELSEFKSQLYDLDDEGELGFTFAHSIKQNDSSLKLIGENYLASIVIGEYSGTYLHDYIRKIKNTYPSLLIMGNPYTNYKLDEYSRSIRDKLFPITFLISFLLILILKRSLSTSLLIFFPSLLSAVSSLVMIKLTSGHLNLVSSIIPLMSFVINLCLMFHLQLTYESCQSIKETFNKKLTPIFLMVSTTAFGFGTLYLSDINAISHFGLLSSGLIIINSIVSLIWFRLIHKNFNIKSVKTKFMNFSKFTTKSLEKKYSYTIAIIISFIGLYGLFNIETLTDATKYFPKSEKFRENLLDISSTVTGAPLLDILIYSELSDEELLRIQNELQMVLPSLSVQSLPGMLTEANKIYTGENTIPSNNYALSLLKSKIGMGLVNFFEQAKGERIIISGMPIDVAEYQTYYKKVKNKFLDLEIKNYEVDGLYHHLMIGQEKMVNTLYVSFLSSLLVIALLASFYLKNAKIFIIFLIVNIVPAFITISILYFLGLSLNIATVMTFSISLGLIVDGSFHIIHHLKNKDSNFSEYYQTTLLPIILSSFILIICFSSFALNSFVPIHQFGLALVIMTFFGLLFDLFILPGLFTSKTNLEEHFVKSHL